MRLSPGWLVAGLISLANAQSIPSADQVTKKDTQFDSIVTYVGPMQRSTIARRWGNDSVQWTVRAFRQKSNNSVEYQLYASVEYQDGQWRFIRTASFPGGNMVPVTSINRSPHCARYGCSHSETVGVLISPAQWIQAKQVGLEVRLNGQTGIDSVVAINPEIALAMDAAIGRDGVTPSTQTTPQPSPITPQIGDIENASALAKRLGCTPGETKLINRSQGVELFLAQCSNGSSTTIRCETGNCRELR